MSIAVIPARGGSKRIPRKNIKPFQGKPMIVWSIEAALRSGVFEQVLVSTDDDEIADLARGHGAIVPFLRPSELSDDFATTADVIAHATTWASNAGWIFEELCCIYATAPFIRDSDIRAAYEELTACADFDFVFSVTEFPAPIFRSFSISSSGGVEMLFPEYYKTRSQDLPIAFHDAAQFYWGRKDAWLQKKPVFGKHSKPYLIPRWRVQDIDTPDDWKRAEALASGLLVQGE